VKNIASDTIVGYLVVLILYKAEVSEFIERFMWLS